MRLLLNVSVVLVCGALAGVTALAQTAPSRAASITSAAIDHPGAGLIAVRRSGGLEAHFDAANITHDGRLTRAQAEQSDWSRVVKHFDEIDAGHKGWVTLAQIHAFNRSHHKHRKDVAA